VRTESLEAGYGNNTLIPHDERRKAFTKAGSVRQVVFKVKGAAVYQFLAGCIDGDGNMPVGV